MIKEIKTIEETVYDLLKDYPETRDDDNLLLVKVWRLYGLEISPELENQIITCGVKPESIRRSRQFIQASGKFEGTKRKERLIEEYGMRDLFGNQL
jgi:hypothetical protein